MAARVELVLVSSHRKSKMSKMSMRILWRPVLGFLVKGTSIREEPGLAARKNARMAPLLAHHTLVYCGINVWRACTNLGDNADRGMIDMTRETPKIG